MSIITRNQKKVLKKISNITKRSIANLAKDAGIEDFFEVDEFYWINKRNKIRGNLEFYATDFSPEKLFLYEIRN